MRKVFTVLPAVLPPVLPSIAVVGTTPCAQHLAACLAHAGYPVNDRRVPMYSVQVDVQLIPHVVLDTADTPLAHAVAIAIGRRVGGVYLDIAGPCRLPHGVHLTLPEQDAHWNAVAEGLLEAFDQLSGRGRKASLPTRLARAVPSRTTDRVLVWALLLVIAAMMLLFLLPVKAHAQGSTTIQARDSVTGAIVGNVGDASGKAIRTFVSNVGHFICDSGCGSPPSIPDQSTFVFGTTSVSPIAFVVDDAAPHAATDGHFGAARMGANRILYTQFLAAQHIVCDSGCGSAAAVLMSDGVANPTIPQAAAFATLYNGTTWDRWRGDTTNGAFVNVKNASIAVTGTFWQATQPVSGTFWQATQPVSIATMPSTPVTGTFWQATQPVSGPLTDTQLRASAVPVSGTFFQATQPVSIAAMPSTPVTGTFWQATQPVSGTFWQATQPVSGPLTDTQLRASAVPVSGTVTVTDGAGALNVIVDSGTTTVTQGTGTNLHMVCDSGCGSAAAVLMADAVANPTIPQAADFPMLYNGTTWDRWRGDTTSGAFVNVKNASLAVTGTFWQATQPVSGTFWQATQPVSGPLTDTQLRASPVPVSGTVTVTDGAGALNVIVDSGTTTVTQATGTNLHIVCDSGCGSAAAVLMADNTANPTIPQTASFGMLYDGATWQRWRGEATQGAFVAVKNVVSATGTLTNNTAAPTTTNVGVLASRATQFLPTYVEGNQVLQSADLVGNTRVTLSGPDSPVGTRTNPLFVTMAPALPQRTAIGAPATTTLLVNQIGAVLGTPSSPLMVAPVTDTAGCAGASVKVTASAPLNVATAVTTRLIVGTASTTTYICAIDLVVAGADNVALIYGTGALCATGTVGLAGGATAATGWNHAANGGLTKGNGQGMLWKVPPANDVCIATSAAVQASGSVTFAQF